MNQSASFLILLPLLAVILYPSIQAVRIYSVQPLGSTNQESRLDEIVASELGQNCEDDLSERSCRKVVASGKCETSSDLVTKACRKSCGLCGNDDNTQHDVTRAGPKCVDQNPFCERMSGAAIQPLCCTAKDMMNATCAKTCKFCYEVSSIPANPIQGMPGMPIPGGGAGLAPTVVTQQDPCDPSKPPTAGVNPSGR